MHIHDQLFKRLLTRFFFQFLELFFCELYKRINQPEYLPLDKELLASNRLSMQGVADLAFKTQIDRQDSFIIVLVETQAKKQKNFAARLLFYYSGLLHKYNLPVYPIVVFAYDHPKKRKETSLHEFKAADRIFVSFNYDIVQLNQLDWRDFVSSKNPLAGALIAKMRIAREERPEVELQSNRIIILSELPAEDKELLFDFKNSYLTLDDNELEIYNKLLSKLNKTEREKIMSVASSWELKGRREGRSEGLREGRNEGRREGRNEGLKEGRSEGLKEGRSEEALALVLRLLKKRFSEKATPYSDLISALSLEELEQLSEDLLDFNSVDDLSTWLNQIER